MIRKSLTVHTSACRLWGVGCKRRRCSRWRSMWVRRSPREKRRRRGYRTGGSKQSAPLSFNLAIHSLLSLVFLAHSSSSATSLLPSETRPHPPGTGVLSVVPSAHPRVHQLNTAFWLSIPLPFPPLPTLHQQPDSRQKMVWTCLFPESRTSRSDTVYTGASPDLQRRAWTRSLLGHMGIM